MEEKPSQPDKEGPRSGKDQERKGQGALAEGGPNPLIGEVHMNTKLKAI